MDGLFVRQHLHGTRVLESVRRVTDMTLDVHLMITQPVRYSGRLQRPGRYRRFPCGSRHAGRDLESDCACQAAGKKVGCL
jgi:hypothetical protein